MAERLTDLTDEQVKALNEWTRTQPALRRAFDYTLSQGVPGDAPPSDGLGDRLSAAEVTNTITFKETEAGGASFVSETLNVDSDFFYLSGDGSGKPVLSLVHGRDEKSLSYRWPSRDSNVTWFVPADDITVEKIYANVLASDSDNKRFYPSVTWTVQFGAIRSHDQGTEVIIGGTRTGGIGFYPGSAAHVITAFDNANIPRGDYVWFRTTDLGEGNGAEEEIHLTAHFRRQ